MFKINLRFPNISEIESRFENSLFPNVLMDVAGELRANLIQEIPEDTGNLKNSVEIVKGTDVGKKKKILVRIGEGLPYAWAVWKGLNPEYYSVKPKSKTSSMVFPAKDWPQYDGRWGPKDFFVFRKELRNNIPPNDFVGRAISRLDIEKIARKRIRISLNK